MSSATVVVVQQPVADPTQKQLLVPVDGQRDWSTGLFGCFSDCLSCLLTCFCIGGMMARIAHRMHECFLIPCCVPGGTIAMRARLRTMGGIRGSICKDYIASICCNPCVVCQMSRELDNMGL